MSTSVKNSLESYLSFRIGSETFAANVKNVLNILEMTKITQVPKSPEYMKGVINLRGIVLPVIDSRIKFGIKETEITTNTCIIVLELHTSGDSLMIGAIVDAVKEVLELGQDDILPPPSIGTSFRSDYLKGMAQSEEGFIMILDAEKVFGTEEIVDMQLLSKEASKASVEEIK
ncbi:MAG: chemotaxis protein CheW [Bacteroidales bacterium]|nr:chemotaxis protein CheW [Bacteroidales bacterium]